MKIMKAVFIFMLDGNQMFQMSINDKRFLVTWNYLLKVLNGNAVFESIGFPGNGFIFRAPTDTLHMAQITLFGP